ACAKSGLALAIATMFRPICYYLFFPLLVFVIGAAWVGGANRKRVMAVAFAFFLPWLMLVGSWQIRNRVVSGSAQFSSIQSVNLYFYRAAGIVALRDRIPLAAAQAQLQRAIPTEES